MSNQRLMKAKEKAGDGYAKTNAIAPPPRERGRERGSHAVDAGAGVHARLRKHEILCVEVRDI